MEKLENLGGVTQYLNDLRHVMDKAKEQPRQYQKQSNYQYKPTEARFKLVVWYKDGNRRTFYSYDGQYHNNERHIDENTSMMKLVRLMKRYDGQYKNAIIYCNMDPDAFVKNNLFNIPVVWFKMNGNIEANNACRFVVNGKNNIVNLKHLEIYSPKKL